MIARIFAALLVYLLLSSCSLWPLRPEPPTEPVELPPDPLAASRELTSAGRFGEALAMLDAAIAQGRNAPAYQQAREKTLRRKTREERRLQDRLLIEQTKMRRDQLPLYEEWARMDPDNREVKIQRDSIRQHLQSDRERLSDCGLRHLESRPDLAHTCLELAMSLKSTQRDQLLLDLLAEQQKQNELVKAQQQQDILEQQRKNRIRNSLMEAKVLYEKDQFIPARKLLNQVLTDDPDNSQAKTLLEQLEAHLQTHLETMLKTGDKLYQEGEIEGAQDVWEAALRLDPENPLAKEKLERAKRVLENLETLRQAEESDGKLKQPPASPKQSE
jgi:tetratricopeptide (TPR) repeat protein